MAKIRATEIAIPASALEKFWRAPLLFEELAIAAAHQRDAAANEADRGVAKGGCFPGVGGDAGRAEKALGNLAIGSAAEMAIEGAKKGERATPIGRMLSASRRLVAQHAPKFQRGFGAVRRKFVEEDDRGEWSVACLPIGEPKLALVAR